MNLTAWLTQLRNKVVAPQPARVQIRPASENDLDWILALVQQEASQGHFHPFLATDQGYLGLAVQLLSLVKRGIYPRPPKDNQLQAMKLVITKDQEFALQGTFDPCPGCVEVIEVDQQCAGFHIWYALPAERELQEVEYYFLAILPEHRQRGYAKLLVNHAFRTIPPQMTITARCYPKSEIMYQCLLRMGFILKDVTSAGTRELYRPAR
jgi:ribosomal protein S18 acetylase RimI-like enzyme